MSQGPEYPPPPPPGQPQYGLPGQPPYSPPPPGSYGVSSTTPYGIHPTTGIPYSDKSKLIAGLLQILIPIGIGRFYMGDTKTGVLQLVLSLCGVGIIWAFVDGIIILVTDSKDVNGYMLRS